MEQVRKATEIISHLRTFGRAATGHVRARRTSTRSSSARCSLMQEQLRLRGIEVVLDLCADELVVFGNPIQLEQVFINLLTNARDALEDARTKRIWIETTRDEELIAIRFCRPGPGIQRELEQRIFDPFFTTKEVGAGTGLGLSITYSIVKEHGGEIAVEQRTAAAARLPDRAAGAARPGGARVIEAARILIVDDDTALLEALPEMLRLRLEGMRIDTCDNAVEALDRVARRRLRRRRDRHQDARHGRARRPARRSSSCGRRRRRS